MNPTFKKVWLQRVKASVDPFRNGTAQSIPLPLNKPNGRIIVDQGYPFDQLPRITGGLVELDIPKPVTRSIQPNNTTGCSTCPYLGTCEHTRYGWGMSIIHRDGEVESVEANIGRPGYLDFAEPTTNLYAFMDESGNIDAEALVDSLKESITLPLHRDDWKDVYSRPDYIHEQQRLRGIPTAKLRREWQPLQDIIWVVSKQDHNAYVVRWKDLDHKTGGLIPARKRQTSKPGHCDWYGPSVPLHLPYIPNEVWVFHKPAPNHSTIRGPLVSPQTWFPTGSLREEVALMKLNQGPSVQTGKLETVPYFETDREDSFDNVALDDVSPYNPDADYNGPLN